MQFMVMVNGAQQGPFSIEQLKGMPPSTMVWTQGMPAWAPANMVPQLAVLFAPAPATPAAAPPFVAAPAPAFAPPPAQPMASPGFAAPGGVFASVGSARPSVDSNYPRPGVGIFQIVRLKGSKNQAGIGNFIVEMRCIHVIDEGRTDPAASIHQPHFPGEDVGHVMSSKNLSFAGNVKATIAALVGMPSDAWDQVPDRDARWMKLINRVTADGTTMDPDNPSQPLPVQPLANMFFEVYGHTIKTRAGGNFTKIVYRRRIPAADVKTVVMARDPSGAMLARLFPNGVLDKIIAAEATQGIVASPVNPAAHPQPQQFAPAAAPAQPQFAPAPQPAAPAFPPAAPAWNPQGGPPAAPPPQPQATPAFQPAIPGATPGAFPGAPAQPGPFPGGGAPSGPVWPQR